jgi:hypothetical protein
MIFNLILMQFAKKKMEIGKNWKFKNWARNSVFIERIFYFPTKQNLRIFVSKRGRISFFMRFILFSFHQNFGAYLLTLYIHTSQRELYVEFYFY